MKRSLVCFLVLIVCARIGLAQCASASSIYRFDYAGHTYKIVKEKLAWNDAASCAIAMGGKLIEIESKAENDTLIARLAMAGVLPGYTVPSDGGGATYVWIGATDKWGEGVWIWDGNNDGLGTNFWNGQGIEGDGQGEPVVGQYFNWGGHSTGGASTNEPDDFIGAQDGAAIALDFWKKGTVPPYTGIAGEWNDLNATNTLYYVIEKNCIDKTTTRDTAICEGQKVFLAGQFRTTGGVYIDSFKTAQGCDSILATTLTVLGVDVQEFADTVCQGDTVEFAGVKRFTTGRYPATFKSSLGCDSLVALNLSVRPTILRTRTVTICRGESVDIGGTMQSEPGQYPVTYVSSTGCDSIVTTTLNVNSADTSVTSTGAMLTSNASGAAYQWIDCGNGNANVSGATSQSFSPSVAGTYAVIVTQNGCTDTSSCYAASPSSVIENNFPAPISVYPNPASDKVTIDLGDAYSSVSVKVTAIDGREVSSVTNAGSALTVPLTDLPSGTYFLHIQAAEKSALVKVIKK